MPTNNQTASLKISEATQKMASKVAAGNKKEGQTKEQTKLIEQGIQKGIAQYKKAQKAKAREADKAKKKQLKIKDQLSDSDTVNQHEKPPVNSKLPWLLLGFSWLIFIAYIFFFEAS